MIRKTHTQVACLLLAGFMAASAQAAEWKNLFDAATWMAGNSSAAEAKYKLEDGVSRRLHGGRFAQQLPDHQETEFAISSSNTKP